MAYYEYKGKYEQHIPLTEMLDLEVKEELAFGNIQDTDQQPVTINTITEVIKKENRNNPKIKEMDEEEWNLLSFQILKRAIFDYRAKGELNQIHSYIQTNKTMHTIKQHANYDQLLEKFQKGDLSIEELFSSLKGTYHQLVDQRKVDQLSIEFLPELIHLEAEDKINKQAPIDMKKDFYKGDEIYHKLLRELIEIKRGDLVFTEAPYDHSIDLLNRYKKRLTDKWKDVAFKYCHSAFVIKDFQELLASIEDYEKDVQKDQSGFSRRKRTIQFIKYVMENIWIVGKNSNGVGAESILSFVPIRVRNDEGTDWMLMMEYEYYKNNSRYKDQVWQNNSLIPGSGIFYNFNRMWRSISFSRLRRVNKVMKIGGWEQLKDIRIPKLALYKGNEYLSETERDQISKMVTQRIREKGFHFKTDNCTTFMYEILEQMGIKPYPYLLRDVLFYCPFKELFLFPDSIEQSVAAENITELYIEDYRREEDTTSNNTSSRPFLFGRLFSK